MGSCSSMPFPLDTRMCGQRAALGDRWPAVARRIPGFGGIDDVGPAMSMGSAADRCVQALTSTAWNAWLGIAVSPWVATSRSSCGAWHGGWCSRTPPLRAPTRARQPRGGAHWPTAWTPRATASWRPHHRRCCPTVPPRRWWNTSRQRSPTNPVPPSRPPPGSWPGGRTPHPTLSAIDVPVLVITSDADTLIPPGRLLGDGPSHPGRAARHDRWRRTPLEPGGADEALAAC